MNVCVCVVELLYSLLEGWHISQRVPANAPSQPKTNWMKNEIRALKHYYSAGQRVPFKKSDRAITTEVTVRIKMMD